MNVCDAGDAICNVQEAVTTNYTAANAPEK